LRLIDGGGHGAHSPQPLVLQTVAFGFVLQTAKRFSQLPIGGVKQSQ
jgi:hypothetical protein